MTYSLLYHTVLEWRPVCPLAEMLLAAGSQKPQVRPFAKKVVIRQFVQANNVILAGTDLEMDTTNTQNDAEMMKEAEESNLHRIAKVQDWLEMWQGSQNLRATQKEYRARNKQMTAVGLYSHTEEIVKASWLLFHHDGGAAFIF